MHAVEERRAESIAGNETHVLAAARAWVKKQKGPVLDARIASVPVLTDDGGTNWTVLAECTGGVVFVEVRVGPGGRPQAGPLTYRLI